MSKRSSRPAGGGRPPRPAPQNAITPVPMLPGTGAALRVPQSPDERRDWAPFIPFGADPYEEYLRAKDDLFTQRNIVYSLFERCTATATILQSAVDEIAAQEIFVTPLETNPSASTLLQAKRAVDVMNTSMNRPGGLQDFVANFTAGYWGSKTGAFISTPRDEHGNIISVSVIHPLLPRPYYGWYTDVGAQTDFPIVNPPVTGMILSEGIWFIDGGVASRQWFALNFREGHYWQVCPNSLSWGAFQEGKPKAEFILPDMVSHIALSDYIRRTTLCTDDAQVIVWDNVDDQKVQARGEQLRDITRRRKDGKQIDPKDEGVRLHVWAKDPDKPAGVKVVNLRAFAEGFDPMKMVMQYGEQIALGFAVNPRRAAPDTQRERFGNAAQAAMLNADEPGIRALKSALSAFATNALLGGIPVRAEFMNRGSAENYAQVTRDVQASQVISQAGDAMTADQKTDYLVRMGVLQPNDVGKPIYRVSDSMATSNPLTAGFLSLRDPQGFPLTVNKAIELVSHRMPGGEYLRPLIGQRATLPDGELDFEDAQLRAKKHFDDWLMDGLPDAVDERGLNHAALSHEVDAVTGELWTDMVRAARANGARGNDHRLRGLLDYMQGGFFNLFGSPKLREPAQARPQHNLFDTLWGYAGKIALGTAGVLALQTAASTHAHHIDRYFNALRAPAYLGRYSTSPNSFDWELGPNEDHCNLCPVFAGHYASFADLWKRTGGLLPGDIRLPDYGNCKCTLKESSPNA